MEPNNKQADSEKTNQEKIVPNQQRNNPAEKPPQQDLKTSNPNPQNKDASQKGPEKEANASPAQKPAPDQAKHIQ